MIFRRQPAVSRRKKAVYDARRASPVSAANFTVWREQHLYGFFSSLGRLMARPWSSLLTALVMGMALALPLLFFLIVQNAIALSAGWHEAREISVFLKLHIDPKTVSNVVARLQHRGDIAAVAVKTPEQGLAEFRNQSGFADALQVLPYNPLPTLLLLTPRVGTNTAEELDLVAQLRAEPEVDLVQYDAIWRRRLGAILDLAERAVDVLAALLGLGVLLVVGNTVRLDIQDRSEEIAICRLLGASKGFVRRPFLYMGFWYGIASGIVALILVALVQLTLTDVVSRLLASYDERFAFNGLNGFIVFAVFFISGLLGWLGAWIASSRHLAQRQFQ